MKGTKSNRERKNGRANELYKEQKRLKNAERPKQRLTALHTWTREKI